MGAIFEYFETVGLQKSSAISQLPKGAVIPQEPFVPKEWSKPVTVDNAVTQPVDLSNLKDLQRTVQNPSVTEPIVKTPASPTSAVTGIATVAAVTAAAPEGLVAAAVLLTVANISGYGKGTIDLIQANIGLSEAQKVKAAVDARYAKAEAQAKRAIENRIDSARTPVYSTQLTDGVRYGVNYRATFANGSTQDSGQEGTAPIGGVIQAINPFSGAPCWYIQFASGNALIGTVSDFPSAPVITSTNRLDGGTDPIVNTAPPQTVAGENSAKIKIPASTWLYGEVPVTVSGNAAKFLDIQEAQNKSALRKLETDPNALSPSKRLEPLPFKEPSNPIPLITPFAANPTQTASSNFPKIESSNSNATNSGNFTQPEQVAPKAKATTTTTPIVTQSQLPSNPDLGQIAANLIGLGLVSGAVLTGIDYLKNLNNQINEQTKPESQQANAKEGSCQAMNSPSCTSGLEGRIKDPLSDKLDAAQIARDAGQVYQVAQFTAIAENFTKVKTFLDNTIVDRAIGVANFAMNVHNALMLSNALGRTLAGVVDTAMNLTPFRFTDATTGTPTTASRAFSTNVSSLIVNLIGQDLYTELTDDWKVANRFYQGTTNLFNKTERLFAGQSKVAQKSGIDIANIGNALRANGVVNPNSYPPMAATKEANTPTELLADVNTPLSSIQSGIRNLNTITKSVSGTVKQISGIQKEFGKLADLTNKESKVRKSLRTQSANQAKVRAKFTLLQIKTIKATGKK
jgi:hypothetical protein